ncbi:hypothetical protein M0R88_01620 [Halorussus gelatinilyticus]|uniref:Right-handed parallel beta-helix repeat-containing protein n=1 Tax=Halorussus gelatinilyticus TaxID=2937524 RepID=A0A8U0IJE6_9EURY|nr:hypothetical protein [Halorussus gelatinilyticus]UPW00816.1 hypothetical protein M0R88_01620 [Halorussus gelatinilyticus]
MSSEKRSDGRTSRTTIDRRDYLRTVGATATAAGLLGGAAGSASAESYETVTVSANSEKFVTVGSGNDSPSVLENKIYDVTADGAAVKIYAEGTDWVIRDVGIRGVGNGDGYTVGANVTASDGTGLIENVYLGDGSASNSGRVGIYVFDGHSGNVTIRDCNVQSFSDNGIYGSYPGNSSGGQGTVQIENCYARNNNISQYRLGTDGSYVRDSVAHVDADVPDAGGAENARGVWVRRDGTVDVENSDVLLEHEDSTHCVIEGDGNGQANVIDSQVEAGTGADNRFVGNVTTTNVGSNADVSMPDCVPTTPADAADGSDCGGSDGGSSDGSVIDDFEDGDLSEYSFDRGSSSASVVSSPTHSGSYALEYTAGNVEAISTSGLPNYPVAGDTFSYRVRGSGGASKTNLSYGVQDHANRYFVRLNIANDSLALYRLEGGSSTELAADWSTPTLSQDTWYELEVQWGASGGHTVTLFDAGGTQVTQISTADSTWTSGGVGYDAYLGSGETAYFDDVRLKTATTVVDDFEDGDISEYNFDRGSSSASVVSSPTHSGSYALEYTAGNVEAISTSGLNAYPSAGDTFSYRVRGSGGAAKTNLSYGVQGHTNRYFVRVNIADDSLALYRLEGGSSTELAADWSTPTLSQDTWYELEVQWESGGGHTVTLLDGSGSQLTQISATDSTWTSGGVGYDAYLGSGESAYFDDVVIE